MHDRTPLATRLRPLPLLAILLLPLAAADLRATPVPGDPLTGSGEVERTLLAADDLLAGTPLPGPVDESAFALPAQAAHPQHRFNGRLELLGEGAYYNFRVVHDEPWDLGANPRRRHLPELDYAFVQHGSHLIPARRGLIITGHPLWDYILEPGRVWRENGDGGMSRAAFPFALVPKNENCVHNGVMSFLFDDQGISHLWYQITLETCLYFQADFWGMLDAVYHPEPVPGQGRLREGYVDEVARRFPKRPIAQLAVDYPQLDAEALHRDLTPEGLTTYGLVVDGIHYAAPCRSRYGNYAFCSHLRMPSYSTAKSAFASVALMRLAQKYGPWVEDLRIADWVPEHTQSPGDWSAVTFGDAIDMATGHFFSSEPFADEEGPVFQNFIMPALTYADKIAAAFDAPYRAPPGSLWVYRSTDTFIATRAMQNFLRDQEGEDADLFRTIVEEVYKPIKIGPGAHTTLRTSDHNWQGEPLGAKGLFLIQDDVAKLTTFLNVDGGRAAGRQILHPDLLAAGLQRKAADRGLLAGATWYRYNNSFFAVQYTPADLPVDRGTFWVPLMQGYGGIIFAMLPYGISYYYFSDYDEFSIHAARAIMTAFGGYRASEIPALATAAGELAAITAVAINNRGQVIGRAASSEAADSRFGAFRYTPGVGLEDLDPSGEYRSEAVAINDAGEVFGLTFADSPSDRQIGCFLYRDGSGFDFLEAGSNRSIRETFDFHDLNEAGDLVGAVDRRQDPQRVPYLYDPEAGWMALVGLDPRFGERPTLAVAINAAGEIVFTTEPRRSGAQDAYVLLRSGRLLRLGTFGRRVNVPAALGDAGRVVGFSETPAGERHAYVFTPGAGLVDLHRRFAESVAGWVTSEGVVGGVFLNPEPDTLFTWDETRSPKLRLEARRADFQALLAAGTVFERLEVVAMNERLEFVGRVEGRDGDQAVSRFFHYAPETGVRDLQVLLDETGSERQVTAVVGLNDRGAVLVQVGDGAVVLSPRVH